MAQRIGAPAMLQPDIHSQTAQPWAEAVGCAKLTKPPPGLQEGLLRQIVGKGGITATAPHQISQPGLPPPHKFFKACRIACLCISYKRRFRPSRKWRGGL
jgi:hypothetical protein